VVSSHSRTPLGVGTNHEHFDTQDSPRPGLRGSHHLPPYNVLCNTPRRLHPNDSFSRDSQVGVPKLSRNCLGWSLGTLGAHNSRLQNPIATSLNQSYSPRRDLSNAVSHSQFGGREEVDSRLLVVGILPITWAVDVQMANARPFPISTLQDLSNDTKNTLRRGVLASAVEP